MARQRKSKNDITKYVIIGIVVLVLLFLVMNVDPTGKYTVAQGQEDLNEGEFRSGEGMFKQDEHSGEILCYTFESELTESCAVKDLEGRPALPEDSCSCPPDGEVEDIEEALEEPWEPDQPGEEAPVEDEPMILGESSSSY
jgi:hypothetical protein